MKKIVLLLFLGFSLSLFGEPITIDVAEQAAISFLERQKSNNLKSATEFKLTDVGDIFKEKSDNQLKSETSERSMFLFNIGDSAGFIIVSGDNAVCPILGYSNEGEITAGTIPPPVMDWLQGYQEQILLVQQKGILPTEEISNMWKGVYTTLKASGYVEPLCKTKWDQSPYYNDMCPYDKEYGKRVPTGCPATAMAQIMKYWRYPAKGFGFHSYNHPKYGILSANFGNTYYDWAAMPNEVNSKNDAVALLMYHCGVAVEMEYGPDGSGSQVIKRLFYSDDITVENALTTYFGYDSNIEGKSRTFYSDKKWKNLIKDELDNGRPVQYAGFGSGGGHTFVCDGYDEDDYFHMNWGWGGSCDGFYLLDNLVPGTGGTGAGNGSYNQGQQILIGIKPPQTESYDLILYDDVSINYSSISYAESFTVSVNVKNNGDNHFYGDFAAAIFDNNDRFIDLIDIKSNQSLRAGYHYSDNLEFYSEGSLALFPGTYHIYICYRAAGGSWSIIGNNFWHNYNDYATLKVKPYTSDISLYDNLNVLTENIYSGDKFEVKTDIANFGDEDFKGVFCLVMLTPDAETTYYIDHKEESLGSYRCYGDGGITFSTDSLEAPPGTYYMTLFYFSYDEYGELMGKDLVGSTSEYFNPIEIVVQEKPLKPDKYENNNSIENAYVLENSTFVNDSTFIKTQGANIQNEEDIDFYAIELEDGYLYNISGTLQDKYTSGNSIYTGDMKLAYSFDGEIWSDTYDGNIEKFAMNGGGTIYLAVTSYFSGEHGTYDLDLTIQRSPMMTADKYEQNNTIGTAYVFDNISFEDNIAIINIADATIHTSSDIDVYLLQFDERYTYYIYAIAEDYNNSEYTANVEYQYSLDGINGSNIYTDTIDYPAYIEGEGFIYFAVGPENFSSIGSYNLKIGIERDTLIGPDIYEPNDREKEAYIFNNIEYVNNHAVIKTSGANLHTYDDIDVYAIPLPEGYSYSISAKVLDLYTSPNYTGDVIFSYSIDGAHESEIFDSEMDNAVISVNEPFFYIGAWAYEITGTYEMEISITRDTIYLADAYEPNNTKSQAYLFENIQFKNDKTTIYIDEANIQNNEDKDFYSFDLEDGYEYTIDILVKDSKYGMFSTYTSDVSFQYAINGRTNTTTYDDALAEPIHVGGNSNLIIGISGIQGTYGVEVFIQRKKTTTSINNTSNNTIIVYPNPCKNQIFVKSNFDLVEYKIFNIEGKEVQSGTLDSDVLFVDNLLNGTYQLRIKSKDGWQTVTFLKNE